MPKFGLTHGGVAVWLKRSGQNLILETDERRRRRLTVLIWALVIAIGSIDYAIDSGDQISLHLIYFIPVALAVIVRNWKFAVVIATACVVVMLLGDVAAGARYSSLFIPCWNVIITFGNYLIIVWLLHSVLALQREMEERVRQRTAALAEEVAERERLEKEIMAIGQKERWSIGHDLHDGLGQHLTGTGFAARVLAEELAERNEPSAEHAWRIVALVEEGIAQTRRLARGLLLVSVEEGGLATALRELAITSSEQFHVRCECHCLGEPTVQDTVIASHLFYIAQEAVRNAARHGKPSHITITLRANGGDLSLSVNDDGTGVRSERRNAGVGLRIMAHRAAMIGASFALKTIAGGGTEINCRLSPAAPNL